MPRGVAGACGDFCGSAASAGASFLLRVAGSDVADEEVLQVCFCPLRASRGFSRSLACTRFGRSGAEDASRPGSSGLRLSCSPPSRCRGGRRGQRGGFDGRGPAIAKRRRLCGACAMTRHRRRRRVSRCLRRCGSVGAARLAGSDLHISRSALAALAALQCSSLRGVALSASFATLKTFSAFQRNTAMSTIGNIRGLALPLVPTRLATFAACFCSTRRPLGCSSDRAGAQVPKDGWSMPCHCGGQVASLWVAVAGAVIAVRCFSRRFARARGAIDLFPPKSGAAYHDLPPGKKHLASRNCRRRSQIGGGSLQLSGGHSIRAMVRRWCVKEGAGLLSSSDGRKPSINAAPS